MEAAQLVKRLLPKAGPESLQDSFPIETVCSWSSQAPRSQNRLLSTNMKHLCGHTFRVCAWILSPAPDRAWAKVTPGSRCQELEGPGLRWGGGHREPGSAVKQASEPESQPLNLVSM